LPRETKSRRVCSIPENLRFIPEGSAEDVTVLTIEEVESLRLCDLESMEQDMAAELMNISRGTFRGYSTLHTKKSRRLSAEAGRSI